MLLWDGEPTPKPSADVDSLHVRISQFLNRWIRPEVKAAARVELDELIAYATKGKD